MTLEYGALPLYGCAALAAAIGWRIGDALIRYLGRECVRLFTIPPEVRAFEPGDSPNFKHPGLYEGRGSKSAKVRVNPVRRPGGEP